MSGLSLLLVLLVFYLYLLARWQHVKRPVCYLAGALGLLIAMISGFFGMGETAAILTRVFTTIGCMLAFVGAVGACYGAELPVQISGKLGAMGGTTTQPPAASPPTQSQP
ncbi:MAG TPA: hypothetical protein VNA25_28730 [Phycisphaerae bacterium]|nr:hypothetical protein [Phycisphaerae bacterium]HUT61842.1 hypothetical protein [Phycisphaerae bacterium]